MFLNIYMTKTKALPGLLVIILHHQCHLRVHRQSKFCDYFNHHIICYQTCVVHYFHLTNGINTRRIFVSIEILFSICDYFNQHSAIHYFHFVIISINTVSFHLFCYWTCVVHYIHQALIFQLCCLYQLKVQCLCLYVCI